MKYFFGIILFFYSLTVFAQVSRDTQIQQIIPPPQLPETIPPAAVPKSCMDKGFGVENKQFVFNNDNVMPRAYILHNTSQGTVIMSHIQSVSGVAQQQSKLEQNKWALISVNDANFQMGCLLYKPPNIGYVDCASVVSVCSIPTSNLSGSLWVVENSTLQAVLNTLQLRGVVM